MAPRAPFTPGCGALIHFCAGRLCVLAGDAILKVIQINEYNMFGECITVIKIPSWVSHLSSRMVERIKLRIGNSSVNLIQ